MTTNDKPHREFWIEDEMQDPSEHAGWKFHRAWGRWIEYFKGIPMTRFVEYSALEAERAKVKELEAKLWVANDRSLRTYDGMSEKADKYDELEQQCENLARTLKVISETTGDDKMAARISLSAYNEFKKKRK